MFRNQYFLSCLSRELPREFNSIKFANLQVCFHHSLSVTVKSATQRSILCLGFIIDPLHPQFTNEQIITQLVLESANRHSFFKNIQQLSGRFVLLFQSKNELIIIGDACCLRPIFYSFYDEQIVVTSSPKLFLQMTNSSWKISAEKEHFIQSSIYKQKEHSWYGSNTIDDRLKKCLPNHFLDLNTKKISRVPFFKRPEKSEAEILEASVEILRGSIKAAINRFTLLQPLTSGWDTRMLLASSRDYQDKITYYIFQRQSMTDNHPDIRISKKLAAHVRLNFHVFKTADLTDSFLNEYKKEHISPRILPKTAGIQYHYEHHRDQNIININGNCGAICRCHFGFSRFPFSGKALAYFSSYTNEIEFVNKEIYEWHQEAQHYAKENNIPILDLFYWECRTGNWAADYPHEQDIAIEEFSPFNNRSLISMQLQLPPKRRNSPNHPFFLELIKNMWSEVLQEPINPDSKKNIFAASLKKNSILLYLKKKISRTFHS